MPIAIKSDIIELSSQYKTQEFARKFLKEIKIGDVIFLYGEMGVGKTTFVKYLINELQKINKLKVTDVTSPTFNLLNEYQINKIKVNHYDLFRLKSSDELKNLDLFEDQSSTITVIEWPQIIKKKPGKLIELIFKYENNYTKRSVLIKGLDF